MAQHGIREFDIVEILNDLGEVRAGTHGTVVLDWNDGCYEVATNVTFAPVTATKGDIAFVARPVVPRRADVVRL